MSCKLVAEFKGGPIPSPKPNPAPALPGEWSWSPLVLTKTWGQAMGQLPGAGRLGEASSEQRLKREDEQAGGREGVQPQVAGTLLIFSCHLGSWASGRNSRGVDCGGGPRPGTAGAGA